MKKRNEPVVLRSKTSGRSRKVQDLPHKDVKVTRPKVPGLELGMETGLDIVVEQRKK